MKKDKTGQGEKEKSVFTSRSFLQILPFESTQIFRSTNSNSLLFAKRPNVRLIVE